ncbi:MAG: DUF3299 domain-containing protein [Thermaurantiacus sp.]
MMLRRAFLFSLLASAPAMAFRAGGDLPPQDYIWRPAATPRGGVSWTVLENVGVREERSKEGWIIPRPRYTPQVRALAGQRVRVAGFMMPLENSATQRHFVLLAYPPGCPFHLHANANQFIEVKADRPFRVELERPTIVSGVLELIGDREPGIFYRMTGATPG